MIRIRRLEIFNYRSCIKTNIDINTDLTALIGVNGVGKSNILNSIQLLKKISRNRFFHQKEFIEKLPHTRINLDLLIDGNLYQLKSDLYYDTDESNVEEIYSTELKLRDLEKKSSKWITIDPNLIEYHEYYVKTRRHRELSLAELKNVGNEDLYSKLLTYILSISYYSATQFSDPARSPISFELEDSRLLRSTNRVKTHEVFLNDLYTTYKNDKKSFQKFINTVGHNGMGLVDNVTFFDHKVPSSTYKVKAGGQIQKIERTKNIIVPSIILDNLTLSPNQLSEGTFKTLALIYYILNDESELLLIEEPEVCVHHGLLSSIIELIKIQSKHKQIFISTHSDFVLDKLKPENIVIIKKSAQNGTIAQTLDKTLSSSDYNALKEYLIESGNLGEYWKEGGFEVD
jgi:AAA15 family ATPase/GTPase